MSQMLQDPARSVALGLFAITGIALTLPVTAQGLTSDLIENQGQVHEDVAFYARRGQVTTFLTKDALV